jgi:dihydroneopterin aldolase
MRLLVSVADARDAAAALAGGADLIDAKDPSRGALGAVSRAALRDICSTVAGARPVSAALGDGHDEAEIEQAAQHAAVSGIEFVKIGFGAAAERSRIAALLEAAVRGTARTATGVVAVAYADNPGPARSELIEIAARCGARGVLIDTAHKRGPGLRQLMTPAAIHRWIATVHQSRLFAAVAGKLTLTDIPLVEDAGADIAGVRGAACDTGRDGRVVEEKVRGLVGARGRGGEGARG